MYLQTSLHLATRRLKRKACMVLNAAFPTVVWSFLLEQSSRGSYSSCLKNTSICDFPHQTPKWHIFKPVDRDTVCKFSICFYLLVFLLCLKKVFYSFRFHFLPLQHQSTGENLGKNFCLYQQTFHLPLHCIPWLVVSS